LNIELVKFANANEDFVAISELFHQSA